LKPVYRAGSHPIGALNDARGIGKRWATRQDLSISVRLLHAKVRENRLSGPVNAATCAQPYVRRGSTPSKDRGRTAFSRKLARVRLVLTLRESDPAGHFFETGIRAEWLKERNRAHPEKYGITILKRFLQPLERAI